MEEGRCGGEVMSGQRVERKHRNTEIGGGKDKG